MTQSRDKETLRDYAEENLLNYAVETGSMDFLLNNSMKPRDFIVFHEEAKELFERYHRSASLPTRMGIVRRLPSVAKWGEPPEERDIPHLIEDLREINVASRLVNDLDKIRDKFEAGDLQGVADDLVIAANGMREGLNIVQIHDLMDGTERYGFFEQQANKDYSEMAMAAFDHPDMNDFIGGMLEGEVHYIVARTGEGKTFVALGNAYHNTWNLGKKGLYISLEMTRKQLGFRLDAHISQIGDEPGFSIQGLRRGVSVKDDEHEPAFRPTLGSEAGQDEYRKYIEWLRSMRKSGEIPPLYVVTPKDSAGPITPTFIEATARDLGVDYVIVDQLELLNADSGQRDRRLRLGEVARDLKLSAERLGIPFIVIHQMNRETMKTKEVTDLNVAESDDIARNADSLIYVRKDHDSSIVTLQLLKLREGPKNRKFAWHWDYDNGVRRPTQPVYETDDDGDDGGGVPSLLSRLARRGRPNTDDEQG